jgi:hypothetical protein
MDLRIFDGHGQLPLFNPDLEPSAPEAVVALWDAVTWADAILIASPEYAHGVTGNMKNTLDWLVGHIPFAYKPVAVFNPSYWSHHADGAEGDRRTMAADLIASMLLAVGSGVIRLHCSLAIVRSRDTNSADNPAHVRQRKLSGTDAAVGAASNLTGLSPSTVTGAAAVGAGAIHIDGV